MCTNIGKYERFLRVVLGLILLLVAFNNYVSGTLMWIVYIVGVILFITGIVGWCGLYHVMGCSTEKSCGIDKITRNDIELAVKESVEKSSVSNSQAPPVTLVEVKKVSQKKSVKKASKKKSVKKASKKKATKKSTKK